MFGWIDRSFCELFVLKCLDHVSHEILVPASCGGSFHLVHQECRHFSSVHETDLPDCQFLDLHVLEYAFNDGIGVPLECHVLLSMVTCSLLHFDDLFCPVVDEVYWTWYPLLLLKHESREHTQLRRSGHVDL
jgi:hypothetical protein